MLRARLLLIFNHTNMHWMPVQSYKRQSERRKEWDRFVSRQSPERCVRARLLEWKHVLLDFGSVLIYTIKTFLQLFFQNIRLVSRFLLFFVLPTRASSETRLVKLVAKSVAGRYFYSGAAVRFQARFCLP